MRGLLAVVAASAAAFLAAPASAGGWLPHSSDATWTYQWTDSVYNTTPTNEIVTVDKKSSGASFVLDWTTDKAGNPDGALSSSGSVSFQDTNFGIVNTDWTSTPPPSAFPILCATLSSCGNSLASAFYNVIWGARAPVLFEPVLQGTSWSATGAAQNDVTSANNYLGTEQVTVPAFDHPVLAAKVQSQITQAGALGDPYGSGIRTTWWVYGVGPVKVVFQHAGGSGAPVTTAMLQSTNLTPQQPPADTDYFPLRVGVKGTYSWTNAKHMKKPEVESFNISQAANETAILNVKSVRGPMKVAGAYQLTRRLDGVTAVASSTKAAILPKLASFPPLGPGSAPVTQRRHFFTPFDLMTFGLNPIFPAYPAAGANWSADPNGRDFTVYGVTGGSRVAGIQKVTVPAGTFQALVVSSSLKQAGFPFGSGTRTMWFAPDRGLVKLVFRHGDGSTSTVQLVK